MKMEMISSEEISQRSSIVVDVVLEVHYMDEDWNNFIRKE